MTIQGTPNEIAEFIKAMRVGNVAKKGSNAICSVSTNENELTDTSKILDEIIKTPHGKNNWSYIDV